MSRDALVVGINHYRHLSKLTTPAEDAEAIARLLAQQGEFRVWRQPAIVKDEALAVGQKTPVTLSELEDALVKLFLPESQQIPDTALFYFSGHGLRKTKGLTEGFLATSEVNPDTNIWGLSLRWLRELLEKSPIRQQIIWLDCCHSGGLLNVSEANPDDRGQGRDRCFIAASRDFESAWQEIDGSYSVLTNALLAGLDPQRVGDRWVTNYSLVDFLNQHLREATQQPVFTNFGQPINLTRHFTAPQKPVTPATSVPSAKREFQDFQEDLGDGITLEMIAIRGGLFFMGSPEKELERLDTESPQHRVRVPSFTWTNM